MWLVNTDAAAPDFILEGCELPISVPDPASGNVAVFRFVGREASFVDSYPAIPVNHTGKIGFLSFGYKGWRRGIGDNVLRRKKVQTTALVQFPNLIKNVHDTFASWQPVLAGFSYREKLQNKTSLCSLESEKRQDDGKNNPAIFGTDR